MQFRFAVRALLAHARIIEGHGDETALFVVSSTASILMIFCRHGWRLLWVLGVRSDGG